MLALSLVAACCLQGPSVSLQLDIAGDRTGQGRGALLGLVAASLLQDPGWQALLPQILRDLDQARWPRLCACALSFPSSQLTSPQALPTCTPPETLPVAPGAVCRPSTIGRRR